MTATEILNAIENNENVSRWTVFRNKAELRELLNNGGWSENTKYEVESLIDSAIESL